MSDRVRERVRQTVEERLGVLRDSTVARLLVEGRLPSDPKDTIARSDSPVDLTVRSKTEEDHMPDVKTSEACGQRSTSDDLARILQREMQTLWQTLLSRQNANKPESPYAEWRCIFCPFVTSGGTLLLRHYQFHQQLLASPSVASRTHRDWLSAYQLTRRPTTDNEAARPEPRSQTSTPDAVRQMEQSTSMGGSPTLRTLLQNPTDSASGFLRSIVRNIMQQGDVTPTRPTSSTIYESVLTKTVTESSTTRSSSVQSVNSLVQESNFTDSNRCTDKDVKSEPGIDREEMRSESEYDECRSMAESPCTARVNTQRAASDTPGSATGVSDVSSATSPHTTVNCVDVRPSNSPPNAIVNSAPLTVTSSSCVSSSANAGCLPLPVGKDDRNIKREPISPDDSSQCVSASTNSTRCLLSRMDDIIEEHGRTGVSSECHDVSFNSQSRGLGNRSLDEAFHTANLKRRSHDISASCGSLKRRMRESESDGEIANSDCQSPTQCSRGSETFKTFTDTGVQCQLITAPMETTNHDAERPNYVIGEAEEGQSLVRTVCHHCGITFQDEVLHSIHMGCHSHTEPFLCNVCGRYCGNKYAFYTHIMRGHQSQT